MAVCYIIGAGDVCSTDIIAQKDDYIICADGGYKYRRMLGRDADMVVGDFDSLGIIPEAENKIVLPCEKDDTDMAVAVEEGLKLGYREFILFGAFGGDRIDHSIGNIQLLHYIAAKGAIATAYHEDKILTAFSNSSISFSENCKGYVSVFSLSDKSDGTTIKGLKYEVDKFTMYNTLTRGLSNEFLGKKASVSVEKGVLLIVYTK